MNTEEARGMVKRLIELRDQLNVLDDEISASIGLVEDALGAMRLGFPLAVPLRDPTEFLAYEKYADRWRLLVTHNYDGGKSKIRKLLADTSRDVRVEGMSFFPDLLLLAVEKLEAGVEPRRELATYIHEVLLFLGAAPKP